MCLVTVIQNAVRISYCNSQQFISALQIISRITVLLGTVHMLDYDLVVSQA
jgi:hypothetical protein